MTPASHIEIIARGLLLCRDNVLLCAPKKGGYFYLPGGHVDPGEPSAQACGREFLEETGLDITVGECLFVNELLFTQNGKRKHELTMVFHVEHRFSDQSHPTSGDTAPPLPPVPSLEPHIEFVWVPLASIVDMNVLPNSVRAWLVSGGVVAGSNENPVTGGNPERTIGTEWLSISED